MRCAGLSRSVSCNQNWSSSALGSFWRSRSEPSRIKHRPDDAV